MSKNVVVLGTQWGDEGKGKIVDLLTDQASATIGLLFASYLSSTVWTALRPPLATAGVCIARGPAAGDTSGISSRSGQTLPIKMWRSVRRGLPAQRSGAE